jgi:ribosomal silencing factor RsfS
MDTREAKAELAAREERVVKNKALTAIENALNGDDNIVTAGYSNEQVRALAERAVREIKEMRSILNILAGEVDNTDAPVVNELIRRAKPYRI